MNNIAKSLYKEVMGSFKSDSSNLEETRGVRAMERKDSHIFYFRDMHKVLSAKVLLEGRLYKLCENSFSRQINTIEERCKVSLNRMPRNSDDTIKVSK